MTIEIADRLCAYRKQQGLSQEELADRIGVSRQAVSKWERAEASPDTDNLILLAKVYGVTMDELLNRDPAEETTADPVQEPTEEPAEKPADRVAFEKGGIHILDRNGDKVFVALSGIDVKSRRGDRVHVGFDGIHVNEDGHVCIDEDEEEEPKSSFLRVWNAVPWPVLCVVAYLLMGVFDLGGGWAFGWIVFLTIPLYYSLGEALDRRRPSCFCYPVLVTMVYLYLGFFAGLWHPGWVLFVTIGAYYPICSAFERPKKEE